MASSSTPLPRRRNDLVIRQTAEDEFVVKSPKAGTYFRIGGVEHFLLHELNGEHTARSLRQTFEQRFGDPLSSDDLDEFLKIVRRRGLLDEPDAAADASVAEPAESPDFDDELPAADPLSSQNFLYWRRPLINPERVLNALEPRLRFVWSSEFLILTLLGLLLAGWTLFENRQQLVESLTLAVRWETLLVAWGTLVLATLLHEMAHGLTCKHFGGEVREIGVLFVFFTPCLYCNVSDAWLLPRKSHRLLVTLAGGYCDLCLWALAVGVWRLTVPGTLPNYLAAVVLTVCGGRTLININPFSRMDGYYLLSDGLEIPNLRQRAMEYWKQHVRCWLWGAPRPQPDPQGGWLLLYGFAFWAMAAAALDWAVFNLFGLLGDVNWWLSAGLASLLITFVSRRVFHGVFESEFLKMITTRPFRTAVWCGILASAAAAAFIIPTSNTAIGSFEVRPAVRSEVFAPIAGFIAELPLEEGRTVREQDVIAVLRVPDLDSQIVRKQAEIREAEANLTRLKVGPRPEQVREQKSRVERAAAWVEHAERELERSRSALQQDLLGLELEVRQFGTELEFAKVSLTQTQRLYSVGAAAGEQVRAEFKKIQLLESQMRQADAKRRARQLEGIKSAEEELIRRERELAEARSGLVLLEAGTRVEDIDAERARRARLQEELSYLQGQQTQTVVRSPASGVMVTPRLREKLGQYVEKGASLCVVEDSSTANVEVLLSEEDIQGVVPDQEITLKARSLPFDTFTAKVERIAPRAAGDPLQKQQQHTLTVYCRVKNDAGKLKAGLTGVARVHRGSKSWGSVYVSKLLRYVRTEFWW